MLFMVVLCIVCVCEGYDVLVVFPVPEKSHGVLGDSLVNTLVDAGYEVTYVTPFPKDARPNKLKYVDISSVLDHLPVQGQSPDAELPEDTTSPRFLPVTGTRHAQQLLKHPDVLEMMTNTTLTFDAVLVEWFYTGLLAPLAALFECPLVWYTPTDVSWQSLGLVSSAPAHRLDLPPRTLPDRVHHIWSQMYLTVWNHLYTSRVEVPAYEKSYRDWFKARRRPLPNYETVVYSGALLLANSHPLLGPAVAVPANVKYIGGHHIREDAPSLPKNLKKVMDSSEAGVIYVNVESDLINTNIQEDIARDFVQAFSQLEQTVIWKCDDLSVNLPQNVYTVRNPPQFSILDHVNTIAYINLGDMVSMTEATHHGIPVIAVPLLEDQLANANMLIRRGCGVSVNRNNLSWELVQSVKTLLANSSYQINARSAKSIFRHRLASPQQEFLHWIETVIRTDGASHLRSPTLRTSTLERYNIDLILSVLMIIWFLTKVARVITAHLDSTDEDHEKDD